MCIRATITSHQLDFRKVNDTSRTKVSQERQKKFKITKFPNSNVIVVNVWSKEILILGTHFSIVSFMEGASFFTHARSIKISVSRMVERMIP